MMSPEAALDEIRALIREVATQTGTAPLTETLKWGEPAFLPAKRAGTTIRLGASDTHAKLFVHCQTTLVDSYRSRFPTEFAYEGNRAVLVPLDQPPNRAALAQVIAMALTYHRSKTKRSA
jgi:Na+-transporting methylmalonyl-CoA/oxaloacetate decarboxylase gamma subunit